MEDRIKDFWAGKSREDVDRAFNGAMTILLLLDVAVVVGVFLLLKAFAPLVWAECWMVAMYAVIAKKNIDLAAPKLKEYVLKRIGHEEDKEDNSREDIEDSSTSQGD